MTRLAEVGVTCVEIPPHAVPSVVVKPGQKLVHLVRHGEATHNEYAATRIKEGDPCHCISERPDCPYLHPANRDARLTQRGRLQATAAGSALARTGSPPELVIVSPLYRTLQTASIALSTVSSWLANTDRRNFLSAPSHTVSMFGALTDSVETEQQRKEREYERQRQQLLHLQMNLLQKSNLNPNPNNNPFDHMSFSSSSATTAASSPMTGTTVPAACPATVPGTRGMPPIIVDPVVRERFGRHICDMRSPREHVEIAFRNFDFAAVPYGPDTQYGTKAEEQIDVANRGHSFFAGLRFRPETCIAVFTHSSFLYNTLRLRIDCPDPHLTRRFVTAEVRTVLVSFS